MTMIRTMKILILLFLYILSISSNVFILSYNETVDKKNINAKMIIPEGFNIINDSWVFVFNPNVEENIFESMFKQSQNKFTDNAQIKHWWKHSHGDMVILDNINDSSVESLISDYYDYISFAEKVTVQSVSFIKDISGKAIQNNPPWGLDRIDQRNLPLDGRYEYFRDGSGVNVYVVDSGIRTTHVGFNGRASFFYSVFDDDGFDCSGHGTHVAGIVGSTGYGVAKRVNLYNVKVLDCNGEGTSAGVIEALSYISENHRKPAIATMSIGGSGSRIIDEGVRRLSASGVLCVVAAGNNNDDACDYSPSRSPEAISVGASTMDDRRAVFSNYGQCVDIFAPGSQILSTSAESDTATAVMSGTSMATPFVSGVAALVYQDRRSSEPEEVRRIVENGATRIPGLNFYEPTSRIVYSRVSGGPSGDRPPSFASSDISIIRGNEFIKNFIIAMVALICIIL